MVYCGSEGAGKSENGELNNKNKNNDNDNNEW